MKTKLLILAALCYGALSANAQTEKGKNLIGGTVSFKNDQQTGEVVSSKQNTFNVAPSYGHFIGKNLAIGVGLSIYKTKNEITQPNYLSSIFPQPMVTIESSVNGFNILPYVKYYGDIVEKFKFFGQANVGFGNSKQVGKQPGFPSTETKYNNFNGFINIGFAIFPTSKWGIELSNDLLGYSKLKDRSTTNGDAETFYFGLNTLTPRIGVNCHF